jgi:hypothetical protein
MKLIRTGIGLLPESLIIYLYYSRDSRMGWQDLSHLLHDWTYYGYQSKRRFLVPSSGRYLYIDWVNCLANRYPWLGRQAGEREGCINYKQ